MEFYRHNADRVPSVAGAIVPERVWTREAYERDLLGRIYADMAPLDPEGILRHEWANARGAIARFDRGAIEIRVIDLQERPAADLAIAALTVAVVRALVEGRLGDPDAQRTFSEDDLGATFRAAGFTDVTLSVLASPDRSGRRLPIVTNMADYARAFGRMDEGKIDAIVADSKAAVKSGDYILILPQFVATGWR